MNGTQNDQEAKTGWQSRRLTIAGAVRTIYAKPTPGGGEVLRVGSERTGALIYARITPSGRQGWRVVRREGNKRKLDSYKTEAAALEAAERIERQVATGNAEAASLSNQDALAYVAARRVLDPFKVDLLDAARTLARCLGTEPLGTVPDLATVEAAVKDYVRRNRGVTAKTVADAVTELLKVKEGRGASKRYLEDLKSRLGQFAQAFGTRNVGDVTTPDVQAWLDGRKLAPRGYGNLKRVLGVFYSFCKSRGFASDSPVAGVEKVAAGDTTVAIFSPAELARLLAAASPAFLPVLAIGAFAGLRSAEIERLTWADVDLAGGHIILDAGKAKTASRRIVPIVPALAQWLAPYAGQSGPLWSGARSMFSLAQDDTAKATALDGKPPVRWKHNGLRHSFISYRLAVVKDAGAVALEAGNSPSMIFRHYRELVTPSQAAAWFAVTPQAPANVMPLQTAAVA